MIDDYELETDPRALYQAIGEGEGWVHEMIRQMERTAGVSFRHLASARDHLEIGLMQLRKALEHRE